MQISNHEITFVFFLHAHVVANGTKIISQVQKTGWPDAAHYYRFVF
jgi:hypothetical protein